MAAPARISARISMVNRTKTIGMAMHGNGNLGEGFERRHHPFCPETFRIRFLLNRKRHEIVKTKTA